MPRCRELFLATSSVALSAQPTHPDLVPERFRPRGVRLRHKTAKDVDGLDRRRIERRPSALGEKLFCLAFREAFSARNAKQKRCGPAALDFPLAVGRMAQLLNLD